jgi:beta-lactamase class A
MRPFLLSLVLLAACSSPDPSAQPDRIASDLGARIDSLASTHPDALIAVSIRDPHTGVALHRNGDSLLHAASTMKVPVLIELFRQAEAGRFSLDDSVVVKNEFTSILDGSAYVIEDDSDEATYELLGTRQPIRMLAERMSIVSSNLATNLLIELVGADSVQATIERLGTTHMRVYRGVEDIPAYRAGLNNTATSRDLALLMEHLGAGTAVSPSADAEMRDILLRQRYDEMIPTGLPGVAVAHKTGWITGIRHDAALVLPDGSPPYALVVLTRDVPTPEQADALGAEIARAVHAALRPAAE